MPKRILDGEGIWTSFKLKQLPEHFRLHYAHWIPLASANGTFEYDPHLIHAKCYAFLLPHVSVDDVIHIGEAFARVGLLFRWTCRSAEHFGHNFGFWPGIDKPGRLPKASRLRARHEKISCLHMVQNELKQYVENTALYDMGRQWSPIGPPMVSLGLGSGLGSQDHMLCSKSSNGASHKTNGHGNGSASVDDLKNSVLQKCEDPEGMLAAALDIIIERAESSGVKIRTEKYLESALSKFNFEGGKDREELFSRWRNNPPL